MEWLLNQTHCKLFVGDTSLHDKEVGKHRNTDAIQQSFFFNVCQMANYYPWVHPTLKQDCQDSDKENACPILFQSTGPYVTSCIQSNCSAGQRFMVKEFYHRENTNIRHTYCNRASSKAKDYIMFYIKKKWISGFIRVHFLFLIYTFSTCSSK